MIATGHRVHLTTAIPRYLYTLWIETRLMHVSTNDGRLTYNGCLTLFIQTTSEYFREGQKKVWTMYNKFWLYHTSPVWRWTWMNLIFFQTLLVSWVLSLVLGASNCQNVRLTPSIDSNNPVVMKLWGFLGFCNVFRRFIPNNTLVISPPDKIAL